METIYSSREAADKTYVGVKMETV